MKPPFPFEADKPLSQVCTFGIGGPARYFTEVQKVEELQSLLHYCQVHKMPFFILGKGSNSLFDDKGFDGLVILNKICFCEWEDAVVHVGAGYSFSLLGTQSARKGFSGLEFASGIPGSVGGAVYMNAGANGSETKDVLVEVSYVNAVGEKEVYSKDQLGFSYRTSAFQQKKGAIVSAKFHLHPCDGARQTQIGIIRYRTNTQPYEDPSAGCVFRNPANGSAGALIEQCGLKGKRMGDAEVSLKHGNFIVNKGSATAKDVVDLAGLVQGTVQEKTGILLEMEVRCIPYQLEV